MKTLQCSLMIVISIALLAGCGPGSPSPKARVATPGRAETKVVEAASAAGYNGSQMRKKIDRVLDQDDARTRQIEKEAGSAASKQ